MKRKNTEKQYTPITIWQIAVFCIVCLFSFPHSVIGGDISAITSITVKQTYNDNIFLVDENPETRLRGTATGTGQPQTRTKSSDFITSISPELVTKYEDPRATVRVSARLDFLRYLDLTDLNEVNHFYNALFRYRLTPYIRFTLDGSYIRISDPGSEIDITGLRHGTTARELQSYGAGFEFDIDELSLIQFNYRYGRDDFLEARRLQREERDSRTHQVNIFYTRDISEILARTYIYSNIRYLNFESLNTEQDNISMTMGFGHQLTETINLKADAGIRYSHENFQRDEQSREDWGFVGQAQLEYQGQWTSTRLMFSHDVQPASGMGTMAQLTEIRLDASRRFGEFLNIRGFGSYFFYQRDGFHQPPRLYIRHGIDEKTLNMGMEINYELSRYFFLTGNYTHTRNKEESAQRERWILRDAERNLFFITLNFRYSFL